MLLGELAPSRALALPLLREAVAVEGAARPADHPLTLRAQSLYGVALGGDEGLALAQRAYETLRARLGEAHRETRAARQRLAHARR
jgi:hypothetical protein